jgi:hypothetical protein
MSCSLVEVHTGISNTLPPFSGSKGNLSKILERSRQEAETYSLVKVQWHFGGMYWLHLQGQRIGQVRIKQEAGSKQNSMALLSFMWLLFNNWISFLSDCWISQATKISCPYIAYIHVPLPFLSIVFESFLKQTYCMCNNIILQHPVALCILTLCSHSLPFLCNFVDILMFTHLCLFII